MRRTHTRIAGAIAALLAAAVAGFSLRPTPKATTVLAARPAEVKTQVIHRTIHIVRHKHAPAQHGAAGTARAPGAGTSGGSAPAYASGAPVVTGASHHSSASTSSGALTTRTSAGHGSSSSSGSVTTRSSRGGGGAGGVTTRSSGGGEHGDGGDGGGGGD